MDRVRGGVFSGAMVLAGLSATLISALIAIGIRQVTHLPSHHPTPIYVQPASGEVAVPDAAASATVKRAPRPELVAPPVAQPLRPAPVVVRHRSTTTGSVTSAASVAPAQPAQQPAQQPATSSGGSTTTTSGTVSSPAPSSSSSPSPSPSATAKGNANGGGNSNGNGGSATGSAGGNGGGSGHHP